MTSQVHKITVSALFLALGLLLPMVFHPFGANAGAVFLPMHIPVLLCGFLCGPMYGACIGILTPLVSSALTGMPPLLPIGIAMVFELATYGFVSGYLIQKQKVIPSLLTAMLCGRIISALMNVIILNYIGKSFTLGIFLTASFVTAIPGILLQIILIPIIVKIFKNSKLHLNFEK